MGVIMGVMSFAAQHKDVLVGLAKGLMVFKIGQTIGRAGMGAMNDARGFMGGMGNSFGLLKDTFGKVKSSADPLATAFSSMGSVLLGAGGVIGGLGKLALAAYTLGGFLFGKTEKEKRQEATSKAQILAAGEYQKGKAEIKEIDSYFKKYDLDKRLAAGETLVNPDHIRMKERRDQLGADVGMTESKLIQEGIKAGIVSELVEDGKRRFEMRNVGPSDTSSTVRGGHLALYNQLTVMFKEKANRAMAESLGSVIKDGQWFGGVKQGFLGYFTEEVAKKIESAEDFDNNVGGTQAKTNQTVNITIQRVTAKDPNRWLAEMDDMANRRNRAPTKPKRGWKGTPK
jgi:hypothetical protein